MTISSRHTIACDLCPTALEVDTGEVVKLDGWLVVKLEPMVGTLAVLRHVCPVCAENEPLGKLSAPLRQVARLDA